MDSLKWYSMLEGLFFSWDPVEHLQLGILIIFCKGLVLQVDFTPKQQNETNIGKNVVNKFRTENKTETKTNIQDEEDVTLLTSLYHYHQRLGIHEKQKQRMKNKAIMKSL